VPSDFKNDGNVDAADYVVWRKTLGGQDNYNLWRTNFGRTMSAGATAGLLSSANAPIPEPSSLVLFSLGAILTALRSRH
jgi:hypothetical protein